MIINGTENKSGMLNVDTGSISNKSVDNTKRKNNNAKSKTIFAGDLNISGDRSKAIEQKKQLARKQAMKLIKDAWDKDKSRTDSINELENKRDDKVSERAEYVKYIQSVNERKEALKEEYGIADDSQEQKDLELLEKYQNNINFVSHDDFSKDEIERLKELQNTPLTEYQKKALSLNRVKEGFQSEIDNIDRKLSTIAASIRDEKSEQVKSQDMIKADNTADKVIEAANDEIMGMLIAEGKDKLDEDAKKAEEKKEEQIEKEQEQDKLEEKKEERKEQEDIIKGGTKTDSLEQNITLKKQNNNNVSEAQARINKLIKENNIINEDIKGIEIDVNF